MRHSKNLTNNEINGGMKMLQLKNSKVELDKQLILSLDKIQLPYGQFNVLAGPSG